MSHGKRMLEAQAQKERTSGTRDPVGRVDDGHLRSAQRALRDDGTPVRSSHHRDGGSNTGSTGRRSRRETDVFEYGGEAEKEEDRLAMEGGSSASRSKRNRRLSGSVHDTERASLATSSPPPRPSVQSRREEGDTEEGGSARRRSSVEGRSTTRKRISVPQIYLGQATGVPKGSAAAKLSDKVTTTTEKKKFEESPSPQRGAARHIDVEDYYSSDEEAIEPGAGGRGRDAGQLPDPEHADRRVLQEYGREGREETSSSPTRGDDLEERQRKRERSPSSSKKSKDNQSNYSSGDAPRYPADRIRLQVGKDERELAAPSAANSFNSVVAAPNFFKAAAAADESLASSTNTSPHSSTSSESAPQPSRSASRSPPPVTAVKSKMLGQRSRPQSQPITGFLQPLRKPTSDSAVCSDHNDTVTSSSIKASAAPSSLHGQRPPPLFQPSPPTLSEPPRTATAAAATAPAAPPLPVNVASTASRVALAETAAAISSPAVVLRSPASPPLRAGVSPRMAARHPTRFDPSSLTASQETSNGAMPLSSPPLSQQSQPPLPTHLVRVTSPPSSCSAVHTSANPVQVMEGVESFHRAEAIEAPAKEWKTAMPVVNEEGWNSRPPSPLPPSQPAEADVPTPPPAFASPDTPAPRPEPLPGTETTRGPSGTAATKNFATAPFASSAAAASIPAAKTTFNRMPSPQLTSSLRRTHTPFLPDYSGFHNAGNDCYGCSALTMLLRSLAFRRALLFSPLVVALRRYDALLTGRPERLVQWSSGYGDTLSYAEIQQQMRRKRLREEGGEGANGGEEQDDDKMTVAEVCKLPEADTRVAAAIPAGANDHHQHHRLKGSNIAATTEMFLASAEGIASLTPAVRKTIAYIQTFTLEELATVLEADAASKSPPSSLHTALLLLTRAQRWREYMTVHLNDTAMTPARRQQALAKLIYHEKDRDYDGQLYTAGIRLLNVASFFRGEFFLGEQEDAHEFFVALMAKLETEAVDFQKRCAAVLAARSGFCDRGDHHNSEENEEDEEEEEEEEAEQNESSAAQNNSLSAESSKAGKAMDAIAEGSTSSLVITAVSTPPPISTALADAWINSLVQTHLLNVIRCRSPGCQHEIVTDEICVNLSLHIPEEEEEDKQEGEAKREEQSEDAVEASQEGITSGNNGTSEADSLHSDTAIVTTVTAGTAAENSNQLLHDAAEDDLFPHPPLDSSINASARTSASTTAREAESRRPFAPCSVSVLLRQSMAFEPLSDYRCDACGRTSSQYQGGCFYTRPPPILVLQLKRFSTDFVNGALRITKNGRLVAAEDALVIYALPSTAELRQQQERQRRSQAPPPRTVTMAEVDAEVQGRSGGQTHATNQKAATPSSASATATTLPEVEERCFCYNAVDKCFTCTAPTPGTDASVAVSAQEGLETNTAAVLPREPAAVFVTAIRSVYRLQSCVLHLGTSLHFGHYVADFAVDEEEAEDEERSAVAASCEAKTRTSSGSRDASDWGGQGATGNQTILDGSHKVPEDGLHASLSFSSLPESHRCWRRANDARVEVLSEKAVSSRRTGRADLYLLLYEKVSEEWVRCPVDAVLPKPVYPAEKQQAEKASA